MNKLLRTGLAHLVETLDERAQTNTTLSPEWNPLDWIQKHFFVYDTEAPLFLYPSQIDPLAEALAREPDGRFRYDLILWSWMKKAAKSTIIAAVADFIAVHRPKASIKLIAHDLKQADSRVGYYIRENILIGQRLMLSGDTQAMREFRKATIIRNRGLEIIYPNGSRIECIPVDPKGEAGSNDDMIVFSEAWGWKNESHLKMWAEMTIAPQRFGYAQRWIDTYAGYVGDSPLLEQLYETIVKNGTPYPLPNNSECYVNGKQFATWVTQHTLPWHTEEYLASERATLTEEQFARMHMNQWVSAINAFIPIEWWDNCADNRHVDDGGIKPITKYDEIVIALDAAVDSDCFAIVAVGRDTRYKSIITKDGMEAPDNLVLRYARKWTPPKNEKLRFWSHDPAEETPASELKRLLKTYNVVQIAYDPYQLEHFVSEMEDETGAWFEPFRQQVDREIGDKALYDMIREGRIAHNGTHADLREHIMNSAAKITSDGRRLRIVQRHETKKVDLTVGTAMACHRACELIAK